MLAAAPPLRLPPQAQILRKHLVPKPGQGEMYTWRDCGPGCDVNLFGRLLHIVSADKVSRLWMDRQGKAENIFFADNEEMPAELLPSAQAPEPERKRGTRNDPGRRFMLARMGIVDKQLEDVAKFMQFDGQILNFKCVWDDPSLGHEGLRDFELKYYLVDDTCSTPPLSETRSAIMITPACVPLAASL